MRPVRYSAATCSRSNEPSETWILPRMIRGWCVMVTVWFRADWWGGWAGNDIIRSGYLCRSGCEVHQWCYRLKQDHSYWALKKERFPDGDEDMQTQYVPRKLVSVGQCSPPWVMSLLFLASSQWLPGGWRVPCHNIYKGNSFICLFSRSFKHYSLSSYNVSGSIIGPSKF